MGNSKYYRKQGMTQDLPQALKRLSKKLFSQSDQAEAFLRSFCEGNQSRPVLIFPRGYPCPVPSRENAKPRPVFQPEWVSDDAKLETLPQGALDTNAFYQLDLSSVFDASPLFFFPASEVQNIRRVLDLCSSPGGKAILASRILPLEFLGCNEVVQKRIPALISNLKRCVDRPVEVYSRDPAFFAKFARKSFDLVLLDVPCSGQSLYGSEDAPSGVFHETIVKKSALRQRRILSEAKECVRDGGYLLYMTCTFSIEENERVLEWFLKHNTDFEAKRIDELSEFQSPLTDVPLYRLFPHQGFGRGGSCVLLQKVGEGACEEATHLQAIWKSEGQESLG